MKDSRARAQDRNPEADIQAEATTLGVLRNGLLSGSHSAISVTS